MRNTSHTRTTAPSRKRPPTPKATPGALPARYRDLTAKQARVLIEIDELARHAHDAELIAEVVRRYDANLGKQITCMRMYEYAEEAEAAGQ
ncbi:MAG: hypothetical protein Q8R16_03500, partial [bacterium]|nr:hypothetical protein [bacterium]